MNACSWPRERTASKPWPDALLVYSMLADEGRKESERLLVVAIVPLRDKLGVSSVLPARHRQAEADSVLGVVPT